MLGYSHATSGALGWLLVAPAISAALGQPLDAAELAVGTVACAGAALIPDLDHPSATIAHTFGPISHAAAKFTALLAGGHRQGTHSLLFSLGFGGFCYLVATATEWMDSVWPAMVLMFCLSAFAFRGMNIVLPRTSRSMKGFVVLVQAAALTYAMTFFMPDTWWWLGLAGALGAIIHLIGDTLTPEGVPWLYPVRWRLSVPIIARTGNVLEKAILGPAMTLGVAWLAFTNFAPAMGWPTMLS
jgi:membrane-bound metal-dependent hydrolase YbcI (DUF457 family)